MASAKAITPVEVSTSDVAFLQYTGGTTGVSKGATLSHGNVLSNSAQNDIWLEAIFTKTARAAAALCALPLYHAFRTDRECDWRHEFGRAQCADPQSARHSRFCPGTGEIQFHVFPVSTRCSLGLLNNDGFHKLDFSNLLLTLAAAWRCRGRWRSAEQVTGCIISEGYGLSETAPVATANRFGCRNRCRNDRPALPSTEISIRDDDGKELPLGEVGEICIKGPQVMLGYWNRQDETAKVMTPDGFFRSGGMGFMDDKGYTKIVDRKKDMILVSASMSIQTR
ncbi:MAG: AMP-binding protein [Nitratireductor sp.]